MWWLNLTFSSLASKITVKCTYLFATSYPFDITNNSRK